MSRSRLSLRLDLRSLPAVPARAELHRPFGDIDESDGAAGSAISQRRGSKGSSCPLVPHLLEGKHLRAKGFRGEADVHYELVT